MLLAHYEIMSLVVVNPVITIFTMFRSAWLLVTGKGSIAHIVTY